MPTSNKSTLKPEELQALVAASRPMLREIGDERFDAWVSVGGGRHHDLSVFVSLDS